MRKVVSHNKDTVPLDCLNSDKIYVSKAVGSLYKLSAISGRWMFCSLSKSYCGCTGHHSSMRKAVEIQAGSYDVFELDSVQELAEWICENS